MSTSEKKSAFVIMPIKRPGTPEHEHYRALFDGVIAPALADFGFSVKRADDFQTSGSITKDIILPLATADLVIADLTALNPNVFYELGVRHTLVRRGTIMIMDEAQSDIPFDVQAYRVIKFRGDIPGVNALRKELSSYVKQLEHEEYAGRDNLVHDWLTALPANVYLHASGGQDKGQSRLLTSLQKQVSDYRDRYGPLIDSQAKGSPRSQIRAALEEAKSGNIPEEIVSNAEAFAEKQDVRAFLEQIDKVLNLTSLTPTKSHFIRLRSAAQDVEIHSIEVAIVDQSVVAFPDDDEIVLRRLATYAHSDQADLLNESIAGFKTYLGISNDDPATFTRPLKENDLSHLAVMLDAYHRLKLHEKALNIIMKANEVAPNRAIVLRNIGRGLERTSNFEEALEYYRQAAAATDSDDQAPAWLASQLYNRDRLVDACEAYALAAIRDPDDGNYFARLARTMAGAMRDIDSAKPISGRMLPSQLASIQVVTRAISAALGCQLTQSVSKTLINAAKYAELSIEELTMDDKNEFRNPMRSSRTRLDFAREVYSFLASPLTSHSNPAAAVSAG